MKVFLLNGSPHAAGCTFTALSEVAGALNKQGVDTEIFHIGTKPIAGCIACSGCMATGRCVLADELYDTVVRKFTEADGIVIGSPVYFAGPNGSLCALLDRVFFSAGQIARFKPGAAVVSCRRGGASSSFDRLNKYFTILQMPLVTSQYWNSVHGFTPDDVRQDKEGLQTMRTLGTNMAWLLKSIAAGAGPIVTNEPREMTNFI